ncbi:MAG: D-alanine--D-alanine ligase [Rickettsiaceae bacterium]|nr:D-alanine--D-alanine ligase [Rickettsiaceae bacterium]
MLNTKHKAISTILAAKKQNHSDFLKDLEVNGQNILDFKFQANPSKQHIAVLGGGMSAEREVSLMSSNGIINSLIDLGHQVTFIDMGANIAQVLQVLKPGLVYNALHGTYGEDGCIPGLLNIMRIPYTGPGVMASSLAFNKKKSQEIFQANNIKIAKSVLIKKSDNIKSDPMKRPYVIKPTSQGSSVGVEMVFEEDIFSFAEYSFPYGEIIVEQYIKGRELQVAVLNGKALGALEIKLLQGKRFYDYEVKYSEGFAQHLCPAPVSAAIYDKALKISEHACNIFECSTGLIRVEFIYNEEEQELYMLEINTHPGMTPLSICPEIAATQSIDYTSLVKLVLESAKFE